MYWSWTRLSAALAALALCQSLASAADAGSADTGYDGGTVTATVDDNGVSATFDSNNDGTADESIFTNQPHADAEPGEHKGDKVMTKCWHKDDEWKRVRIFYKKSGSKWKVAPPAIDDKACPPGNNQVESDSSILTTSGTPTTGMVVSIRVVLDSVDDEIDGTFDGASNVTVWQNSWDLDPGFELAGSSYTVVIDSATSSDNGDGTKRYEVEYTVTLSALPVDPDRSRLDAVYHVYAEPPGEDDYVVSSAPALMYDDD